MYRSHSFSCLGMFMVAAVANKMLDDCISSSLKRKYTMNVVLLDDDSYEWSLRFVEPAVERAIEEINTSHGTA